MLIAKQISDVVNFLKQVEKATMKQWEDPKFVGTMCAEAFIVGMPLRMALATIDVEIKEEA